MQLPLYSLYLFDVFFEGVPKIGHLRIRVATDKKDEDENEIIRKAAESAEIEDYSRARVKPLPPYTDPWEL